jgi:ABC-type lipoprotein release transport system permease subunit
MPFARRLLYNVSPFDPLTFGAVATFLVLIAFVASYVPARRATRVDPVVALRGE